MRAGRVSSEASPADDCWVSSPRAPGGRPGEGGGQKDRGCVRKQDIAPTVMKQVVLCDTNLESGDVQILPEGQTQHVQIFAAISKRTGQCDEDWREEEQK